MDPAAKTPIPLSRAFATPTSAAAGVRAHDGRTARDGWEAEIDLRYSHRGGRTVLGDWSHRGPLCVQRSFHPEPADCCHSYLLHPPGGIAGGDRLSIRVAAEIGSNALLTTPAATKVYRSDGRASRQTQDLRLEAGARLEWLPQETICHSGAEVSLETRVELNAGARFVGWEVICLGLPCSDAPFERGHVEQRIEVWREATPLLCERTEIRAGSPILDAAWGLAGRTVFGTLVFTLEPGDPDVARVLDRIRARVRASEPERFAASALDGAIVCRVLGDSALRCRALLVSAWKLLRAEVLGLPACPPRIWNT